MDINAYSLSENIFKINSTNINRHKAIINGKIKLKSLKSTNNIKGSIKKDHFKELSVFDLFKNKEKYFPFKLKIKSDSISKILPKIKINKSKSQLNMDFLHNINSLCKEKYLKDKTCLKQFTNKKMINQINENNSIKMDKAVKESSLENINNKIDEILNIIDDDTTEEINKKIKDLNKLNFNTKKEENSLNITKNIIKNAHNTQSIFNRYNNYYLDKGKSKPISNFRKNNNNLIFSQLSQRKIRKNDKEENRCENFDYMPPHTSQNFFPRKYKINDDIIISNYSKPYNISLNIKNFC